MIWPFKKRFAPGDGVYAVYDAIVAQSRQPKFYSDWAVPDTVQGRFDMICLHVALVFHHLRGQGDGKFSQDLFDLFFADMDRSLREMGVGDIAVPKRIEKMGEAFYGLLEKITEALDLEDHDKLIGAINRNILSDGDMDAAGKIAEYAERLANELKPQSFDAITSGKIDLGVAP